MILRPNFKNSLVFTIPAFFVLHVSFYEEKTLFWDVLIFVFGFISMIFISRSLLYGFYRNALHENYSDFDYWYLVFCIVGIAMFIVYGLALRVPVDCLNELKLICPDGNSNG